MSVPTTNGIFSFMGVNLLVRVQAGSSCLVVIALPNISETDHVLELWSEMI